MTYTITRELFVADAYGKDIHNVDVRYTFTVSKGIPSRNWTNAADGNFYPAEGTSVDVTKIEVRQHDAHPWAEATGLLFDMLLGDTPDEWFIEQAMEDAE